MAKRTRKQAKPGRRVSRPRRSLFLDESGFTGPDLLERSQPFVAYAAVEIEHECASKIIGRSRERYGTQAAEIKASNLLTRPRGRRQTLELLREVSAEKMRILVHNKRLALAAKFVEYILEPGLTAIWGVLVNRGFHRFVTMLLYGALEMQNADAEELVRRFSDFMRGRDDEALWELLDAKTTQHAFFGRPRHGRPPLSA